MRAVRLGGVDRDRRGLPVGARGGRHHERRRCGPFTQLALQRALTGKVAAVTATVTEFDEG